ncbi:lipopolysaccharide biosynthesis protein [Saccharothrix yanglingensis]|uniref:Polysaccharide biosynthesis protein n=1 Tax=Saccharothrix yanglingensis TaxID=659496 RepID=A0ABU0WVW5_9PSEU|nr:hypothetical protein [Saccharothrix yanglingensis]MDQ2583199.1 hypothetical protein [Saccharothrix yanglingensis]
MSERPAGRSLGVVGIAVLIAAGLGYPILIIAGRVLSPADSAVFLTFWGLVFGVGSTLSPVEQEVSRLAAVAHVAGGRAGAAAGRTVVVAAAAVGVFGLCTLLPPVSGRLFGEHAGLAVVSLVGSLGFALLFGTRGLLVGSHRHKPYGALVVAEALIRLVLFGGAALLGMNGLVPLAVAVAAGSFAFLPFGRLSSSLYDRGHGAEPWGRVARRILVLMLGAALTASVLTGYPAIVKLFAAPGDAEVLGGLFFALTVARLPLLLLSPVQAMAVPTVVRLSRDEAGRRRLRGLLVKGSAGAFAVALAGAGVGWLLGPWAVRLLFGSQYVVAGWAVAGLVWSSVLVGAVMLLAGVLVARTRGDLVLVLWAVVAGLSVVVLLAWPGGIVARAVAGLVIAPTVGAALATLFVLRPGTRPVTVTR